MFTRRGSVGCGVGLGEGESSSSFASTKSVSTTSDSSGYRTTAWTALDNLSTTASVSYWFKSTAVPSSTVYCMTGQYQNSGFVGRWTNNLRDLGYIQLTIIGTSGVIKNWTSLDQFDDEAWHHICWVWNSGTLTTYIDGSEYTNWTKTTDLSTTAWNSTSIDLTVLCRSDGTGVHAGFLTGKVDDFAMFSVALNASEYAELWNSGAPGDVTSHSQYSNAIAYYLCGDDASDSTSTLIDQTSGGNDSTAFGTVVIESDAP